MRKKLFFASVLVAMMAMVFAGCSKSEDDEQTEEIYSIAAGTWVFKGYCDIISDNPNIPVDVPTTITLRYNKTATCDGLLPNGESNYYIEGNNIYKTGIYIHLSQNGKEVCKIQLKSYTNDRKEVWVMVEGITKCMKFDKQ